MHEIITDQTKALPGHVAKVFTPVTSAISTATNSMFFTWVKNAGLV